MKRKIILDTNFLLIPVQFKVDIFSEIERITDFVYELCIIDKTIQELQGIKGKDKPAAGVALQLIEKNHLTILPSAAAYTDDAIVNAVRESPGMIVATNDVALARRVRTLGARLIRLRQKKYLLLE